MKEHAIERRRARRAVLQAPLVIQRGPQPGTEQLATNVSLTGVYFETEHGDAFQLDDMVTASVTIPETQRRDFPFTRLAGRGRVVRVSPLPDAGPAGRKHFGIALEFSNDATILTASPPWG